MEKPIVYLVGAGPGDRKLLTLKGLEVLQNADVVLYDRLVNPLLLCEVNSKAELIYCGKLPDRHLLRQEHINQLMVEKALEGKIVVRLKGGDPAVFGRVGEEAKVLKEHGIPYEIVPGITSGIACATYAGIPVTHRDYASSFAVVTGHTSSNEGKPTVNWSALSKGVDTIAFYMGVKHLPYISKQLLAHGKALDTPVAVIQWGTHSKQRTVVGTLSTIHSLVEELKVTNPAITLVGETVSLREELAWFESKPLFNQTIFLVGEDEDLEHSLCELGANVCVFPRYRDKPVKVDIHLEQIKEDTQLIFLNKRSVELFFSQVNEQGFDIREIKAQFFAETPKIAKLLRKFGFRCREVEMVDENGTLLFVGEKSELHGKDNGLVTHESVICPTNEILLRRVLEDDQFITAVYLDEKVTKDFFRILQIDLAMTKFRNIFINDAIHAYPNLKSIGEMVECNSNEVFNIILEKLTIKKEVVR